MTVYEIFYARVSRGKPKPKPGEPVLPALPSPSQQVDEMTTACAARGHELLAVIMEPKAVSASEYSIRARPGYKELLDTLSTAPARIRRTEPHAEIILTAWEDSRISRRPVEREELMALCKQHGVSFNYGGAQYDPSNPDHRLTLRITGATAAHATDMTSKRVTRAVNARAKTGKPHGRMPRLYTREYDTARNAVWLIDPVRGPAFRAAVDSILNGESGEDGHSVRAATHLYNQLSGDVMNRETFRQWLLSPTMAAIRTLRGEEYGNGKWPAIITAEEHYRLVGILTDPERYSSPRGTAPKYLLSYSMTCGKCESHRSVPIWYNDTAHTRCYTCRDCKGVTIQAEPLEEQVRAEMIAALTDPALHAAVNEPEMDSHAGEYAELRRLQEELDDWCDQAGDGKITNAEYMRIRSGLVPRIEALKASARSSIAHPLLARYAGPEAARDWDSWPLEVRKGLIRATLTIRILPVGMGSRLPLEERVKIEFRL